MVMQTPWIQSNSPNLQSHTQLCINHLLQFRQITPKRLWYVTPLNSAHPYKCKGTLIIYPNQLTSGLVASGSSILALSSQSSGFLASGSGMVFGGRKSQSSSKRPPSTLLLSILTSYVLSGLTMRVYRWVNSSS